MAEIIYAEEHRVVVRIHTREEVKKLFSLLGAENGAEINEVMHWPYVALKLFAKEYFAIGFNETEGYVAINPESNFITNNVEIEINHHDTLAYFAAMIDYHMTNKKEEDLRFLDALKFNLADNSEFGYELPTYKSRGVQEFNSFLMSYDYSSSTKSVYIGNYSDISLLEFAQLFEDGIPDFYESRQFLESLVIKAKEHRTARAVEPNETTRMDGEHAQQQSHGVILFSLSEPTPRFGWSPAITEVAESALKGQTIVQNNMGQETFSAYDLIQLVLKVKNNSLDLQGELIKTVVTLLRGYDKATVDACVAHLLNMTSHSLINDSIVEL